jgi:hypothetical protein
MHDAPPSAHQLVCRAVDLKVLNRFDYKGLSPEVARTLRKTAVLILEKLSTTTREIVEIGRLLIAVKRTLQRGQFVAWVEAECVFSLRSAQNYMRAARFVDERNATVANLPPASLYRVSAKNAPPEAINEVMALVATGQIIYDAEVTTIFENCSAPKRESATNQVERKDGNILLEQDRGLQADELTYGGERGKKEALNANVRIILDRFGLDGALFLLGIRDDIVETLSVLEQEISRSGEPGDGA